MAFPSGAVPGLDVSHYQEVVDWPTVAGGGKAFAFAKASEGGDRKDGYVLRRNRRVRRCSQPIHEPWQLCARLSSGDAVWKTSTL
jgi:GH25 family lysozyme M1 (1,4-beta-N-acetylmuramidase)